MGNGGYEAAYGDIRNLQNSWNSEEAKIRSMAQRLEAMLSEISAAANKAIQADQSAPQAGHQSVQAQQKAQHISDLLKTAKEDVQNAIDAVHALSGQLNADAGKLAETAATYQRAEQAATGHVTGQAQLASYTSPGGGSGGGYAGGGSGGGGGAGGAGGGVYSGGGAGTPVAPNAAASSPQVEQWVKEAIKELEKEGVPASKLDPNAIKLIIMHESGGNPNAINRTDINAQEGHPSQGLMQTIPSTFNQYASPGHGNIVNPVDNIMAGCKYAIARYGSLDSVPGVVAVEHGGSYVGY